MTKNSFNTSDFTILMVDDIPKNLQVLGNILKNEKYNLEFATSGIKALNWLKNRDFDLILLDLMMPEMNGFEVCQKIRENSQYDDMPIIFLTAKIEKKDMVRGFELGGQDYITKPFDSSELLARVKTHLELRQSKQRLNDLNKWLEKTVAERTVELQRANERLTEANQQLKKLSDELISLDIEKAEFLQIISHEIRTPLNAILGFLEIIKSRINDDKILNYFKYIDISSNRLEQFALQALLITELRTKMYGIEKNRFEIKTTLWNTIRSEFGKKLSDKNIELTFDFNPPDISINADNGLFQKCCRIVIENAINYNKIDGKIIIKASYTNGTACIETIDQGPGFTAKAINNLYKLFVPGKKHVNKNMGLDLAVVNLIMENHGGRLEVKNMPDGGANVKLIFPNN